jgi:amidohydrolase
MTESLRAAIGELVPEITALRHELHQYPEIRFEERRTSDRIARYLAEAGIPHKRGYAGGTGIVAWLPGSGEKTIALRADMDALELQEQTGVSYASRIPRRMHACGHDGHTACLCGAAKALSRVADQLRGTVKFIFQPAEELGAGARRMLADGVLDGVDAVFALHAWPAIPVGRFGLKSGPLMASADWFRLDVRGRGGHGADPASCVDPIIVAAHLTTALQTIVSREINPWDAAVVTVARIEAGVASNIIPETAVLEGTFRALTAGVRDTIARAVPRIAEATAAAYRATAKVTFGDDSYAPLVNDPEMTEFARAAIAAALSPDAIVEIEHPSMTSEDFAFYLQRVPGAFLWLGIGSRPPGQDPPLHSPHFNFNDQAIPGTMQVLTSLATRFLA